MNPLDVADVLTANGFTKATFDTFVKNALKPVQRAQLQAQITAANAARVTAEKTANDAIAAIQAQIDALS